MITAAEALALPGAQLTAVEVEAVEHLLGLLDSHVRTKMDRGGCDVQVTETRRSVIAEVNQRLKRSGWQTNWQAMVQRSQLDPSRTQIAGYALTLAPDDSAYMSALKPAAQSGCSEN